MNLNEFRRNHKGPIRLSEIHLRSVEGPNHKEIEHAFGNNERSHSDCIVYERGACACEIIDCEMAEGVIIRNHFVYDFLDGACDDLGDVPCSGRVTAVGERCTQMQTDGSVGLAGDPNGAARSVVTVRPTRSFKIDGHRVL
ncbi:MAG: hypothetical protein E2O58_05255 [Gammaproteobacteria bacterium]|nr:MAG: hypothetical protein E2O58_05255 [Gammaproteobacteria bacterium]